MLQTHSLLGLSLHQHMRTCAAEYRHWKEGPRVIQPAPLCEESSVK